MPPKKRKITRKKFLKKDQLSLISDLQQNYSDTDSIIDKLLDVTDLCRCVTRRKFVSSICAGVARPSLVSCIESMMDQYLLLYKKYMKSKKFAMFEQAWMEYIHEYFDDGKS